MFKLSDKLSKKQRDEANYFLEELDMLSSDEKDSQPKESIQGASTVLKTKILFVEDCPDIMEFYTNVLEPSRYKSLPAFSANEALSLISHNPDIKLMVVDLKLPGTNGLQFMTHLKKNLILEGIPIIVSSGFVNPKTLKACKHLGVDSILVKPQSREVIKDRIQQLTSSNSATPSLYAPSA